MTCMCHNNLLQYHTVITNQSNNLIEHIGAKLDLILNMRIFTDVFLLRFIRNLYFIISFRFNTKELFLFRFLVNCVFLFIPVVFQGHVSKKRSDASTCYLFVPTIWMPHQFNLERISSTYGCITFMA